MGRINQSNQIKSINQSVSQSAAIVPIPVFLRQSELGTFRSVVRTVVGVLGRIGGVAGDIKDGPLNGYVGWVCGVGA